MRNEGHEAFTPKTGDQPLSGLNGRPILFVASVGITLKSFVAPLARRLHSVGVRCVGAAGSLVRADGFERLYELPDFRRSGPIRMRDAYRRLYEIVRTEKPGLLHLHNPAGVVVGRLVARRLNIQSVATIHGTFLEPVSYRGLVFAATEAALARLSTRTVVLNEDDARFYRRFTSASSVSVAPVGGMGINLARIRAASANPVIIGSSPSIVVVGRLTAEKNLDVIVEAFREVRHRHASASLTFVGSAVAGDRLWKVPLGGGIAHQEWLADPYPVIAGADLMVSASRREGFALVVAEALLAGVPVVSVTNRGAREIQRTVHSDRLAIVENDPKALTDAVLRSLALKRHGSMDERLARRWSEESAVQWHTDLIGEVLAQ